MIIKCEFSSISGDYTCVVIHEKLSHEEQLFFKGKHKEGKCDDDVKRLSISASIVLQIPQSIGLTFKNIESLSIINSKLNSITKFDLKHFKNLRYLDLTNNSLKFLPGDLFTFVEHLGAIDFSYNCIEYIGPKLLDSIQNLTYVNFTKNVNIDHFWGLNRDKFFLTLIKSLIQGKCYPRISQNSLLKLTGRDPIEDALIAEKWLMNEGYDELSKSTQTTIHIDPIGLNDFTFKVDGIEFKAHKKIVAEHSEAVASFIKLNPEAESYDVQDTSAENFHTILESIYTDKSIKIKNLAKFFKAVGNLKITELLNATANLMISKMNHENNLKILLENLKLANEFKHDELKLKAFEEIKKHFPGTILKDDLAGKPEKLEKIIETKMRLEQQLKDLEI